MTQVDEKTQSPEGTEPSGDSAEAAAPAEATPKTPKSWGERMETSVKNGRENGRYQWFKEFFDKAATNEDGSAKYPIDIDTIAIVMTLVNPLRQTDEYKTWDAQFRAEQGTAGPKVVEPKTPEEIREYAAKAKANLERQQKAAANAQLRAERAAKLMAQLEAEESGVDEEDEAPDAEEQEDDAF